MLRKCYNVLKRHIKESDIVYLNIQNGIEIISATLLIVGNHMNKQISLKHIKNIAIENTVKTNWSANCILFVNQSYFDNKLVRTTVNWLTQYNPITPPRPRVFRLPL